MAKTLYNVYVLYNKSVNGLSVTHNKSQHFMQQATTMSNSSNIGDKSGTAAQSRIQQSFNSEAKLLHASECLQAPFKNVTRVL